MLPSFFFFLFFFICTLSLLFSFFKFLDDNASDKEERTESPPPKEGALSDEDDAMHSDEEVVPSTPRAPASQSSDGRGKKRKLVDRTFEDDDGFLGWCSVQLFLYLNFHYFLIIFCRN